MHQVQAGLSYSLGTPTVDSYKSFAIAVSKVPGMGAHQIQLSITELEYFCLEDDNKITIGNNCIYDSKNQWWNLNNDIIHVRNHISSDDTEMTISWIDYNATRAAGWRGFIQVGQSDLKCIQIMPGHVYTSGDVLCHNQSNWVEVVDNVATEYYDYTNIFGYKGNGSSVGVDDYNRYVVTVPNGEVHFVMTFKKEDTGYYLIKVYTQSILRWYGRIKPAIDDMSINFENIWIGRGRYSQEHGNGYNISSVYDIKVLRKALTQLEIQKMYTNIDIVTNSKIFYKLNGAVTVSDNNGTLSNSDYLFKTNTPIPNDSLYSLGKTDNDGSIEFKITSTSECIIGISNQNISSSYSVQDIINDSNYEIFGFYSGKRYY